MIEDVLYQLSQRDLAGSLIIPFALNASVTLGVAGVLVDVNFINQFPVDRLVVLESFGAVITAAAGSEPQSGYLTWLPTTTHAVVLAGEIFPVNGVIAVTKGWGRPFRKVLPPNPSLIVSTRFTISGLHTVTASLTGFTIPRGNVSGV